MRRISILVLLTALVFTGCIHRDTPVIDGELWETIPTGPQVEEGSLSESELRTNLLRRAMLNDKKVNNSGSYRMLNEFQENIDGFYVADIDHDDINEVVLVDGDVYYSLDVVIDTVNYERILFLTDELMLNQKGYWQYVEIENGIAKYLMLVDASAKKEIKFDMGVCIVDGTVVEDNIESLITSYYSGWATCHEYTEENINNYIFSETENIKDNQLTLAPKDAIDNYDGELSLMQKVLLGKEKYIDTEDNTSKIITDTDEYVYYKNFLLVDYDNDNKQEVVVSASGRIKIFYEINGQIYSFNWGYRNMAYIYMDGVFEYNPGVYYRITKFTTSGAVMEEVLDYTPAKTVDEYLFSKYEILKVLSSFK